MKNRRSGFTLLEVVLVVVLIGVVTTVAYSVFFTGQKSFKVGVDKGVTQADYRIIREQLANELRYILKAYDHEDKIENHKYFSLELVGENLEKRNKDGVLVKKIPVRFEYKDVEGHIKKDINIKINDRNANVSSEDPNFKEFSIYLENYIGEDVALGDIIYYTYPKDTSIKYIEPTEPDDLDETIPLWDKDILYSKGTKVRHGEAIYVAINDNTKLWEPGTVHDTWNEVTDDWVSTNRYSVGDLVLYEKQWYMCNHQGATNIIPGSSGAYNVWKLIE